MNEAKSILLDAKRYVYDVLHSEFSIANIPEIADMIKSIECLEKYVHDIDPKTMDEYEWLLNRVESELKAAKTYHNKWLDTKEHHYKTVAKDELRHAEGFINLARQKITHQEDKEKLQSYVEQYNILNKDLI